MKYNSKIHHRKSIRLKNYDYSQAGLYFITICTQNRECLFGEIANQNMILNDAGQMVVEQWLKLIKRFPNINFDEYIVMPNHFHGIIEITVGAPLVGTQNNEAAVTVGGMVGAFKSITCNKYIGGVKQHNWRRFDNRLWQRNYWEHIIRNQNDHNQLSDYIRNNPAKWENDQLNTGWINK